MTGLVGAIVEAWDELRIHKVRVLLALIGVAVAVTAITTATALIDMFRQGIDEQVDRSSGRDATLMISAWPVGTELGDAALVDAEVQRTIERYGISFATRDLWAQVGVTLTAGQTAAQARVVDPDFGVIYRTQTIEGRWFVDADTEAYAPLLVVNERMLADLGARSLDDHPTALIGTTDRVTATVIGVVPNQWKDEGPMAYVLYDHWTRWIANGAPSQGQPGVEYAGPVAVSLSQTPSYALWVPEDQVDALAPVIRRDLSASVPGYQVDVQDTRAWGTTDFDTAASWIGFGVGTFSMLLGGLGLVNISLVTVRYRIREIGIRRSFGATSGRVFFGVVMESVVATAIAGLIGVVLSVAVVKVIPLDTVFGTTGLQDAPPFPLSAAAIGMAAAIGVGALAGVLPAEKAVRAKVIDAIRY